MVNAANIYYYLFALAILFFSQMYGSTGKGQLITENGSVIWLVG